MAIDSVSNITVLTKESLLEIYGNVFISIGEYKKPFHIEVDSSVPPVIQHCWKVPYARYDNLKQPLCDLEKKTIVASVDKPTGSVHNLVITEKRDGRMRVCLDRSHSTRQLNASGMQYILIRCTEPTERHEDLSGDRHEGRILACQIFRGIVVYLYVPHSMGTETISEDAVGISSPTEVMQKRNAEAFSDIHGATLPLTSSQQQEMRSNDAILHRGVLQHARRENVVFNAGKILFNVTTVTYMGNVVTKDGMRPDPDKIEAIVNMPKPTDKHGLLLLLGMNKYLSQYIPNESSITAPLRSLLKKDAEWSGQHEHDAAMDEIRKTLACDTVRSGVLRCAQFSYHPSTCVPAWTGVWCHAAGPICGVCTTCVIRS